MDRPRNLMQILGVMRLSGRVSLVQARELIAARFLVHERFRMIPVDGALGATWQRDPGFDIREHVREVELPADGGEAALRALLGEFASTPLAAGRPLWEFVLVQSGERHSALVMRIHHCYADGIALVRVMLGLADPEAGAAAAAGPPARGRRRARRGLVAGLAPAVVVHAVEQGAALLEHGLHLAMHPDEAGSAARAGLGVAAELAHVAMLPDEPDTALRGPLSGTKQVAWAHPVPLAEVRAIAHALDCSLNDVLIAGVAAALGAWLRLDTRRDVRGLVVRAAVPVNLRPVDDPERLGNRFGLVFVELPAGASGPLERVYAMHAQMQALKQSWQPILTLGLLSALGLGPRALQSGAIDLLSRKASLVMSNVPGPREPLVLAGNVIDDMLFWVPQSGDVGVGVSVLSYAGEVQFGVIADRALVDDPAAIARRFGPELRRIAAAARRLPPRSMPPPVVAASKRGPAPASRRRPPASRRKPAAKATVRSSRTTSRRRPKPTR
jgi:WS/DGAT/MGAT family acyltransferase